MIQVRKSKDRYHAQHGWLESHHTFSFANYYDPAFTGFRDLLVINEDQVQPGQGFGKHAHQDMEIISYILKGELEHKDSLGTGSVLRPGDVQRMSAGSGVLHSEFNHSKIHPVHFLQIWISPKQKGIDPSYQERTFTNHEKHNQLCLLVSPTGEQDSLRIQQDAKLFASLLDEGTKLAYSLKANRYGWVQIAHGAIKLNGVTLEKGDGAALVNEHEIRLIAKQETEFLLFDLS